VAQPRRTQSQPPPDPAVVLAHAYRNFALCNVEGRPMVCESPRYGEQVVYSTEDRANQMITTMAMHVRRPLEAHPCPLVGGYGVAGRGAHYHIYDEGVTGSKACPRCGAVQFERCSKIMDGHVDVLMYPHVDRYRTCPDCGVLPGYYCDGSSLGHRVVHPGRLDPTSPADRPGRSN
jgi:hypothetical protein